MNHTNPEEPELVRNLQLESPKMRQMSRYIPPFGHSDRKDSGNNVEIGMRISGESSTRESSNGDSNGRSSNGGSSNGGSSNGGSSNRGSSHGGLSNGGSLNGGSPMEGKFEISSSVFSERFEPF